MSLPCQRDLFSLPPEVAYLNCAYMGPLPEPVRLAGYGGIDAKMRPYEIATDDFFLPVREVKQKFAQLVGCSDADRIAIMPSVSYGIENAVRNISMSRSQYIVLVGEIFPSNYYAWKKWADHAGASLRVVDAPTGGNRAAIWNEKILASIDGDTAAVALPHVHWTDGTLFDLAAVRQRTREVGAMLVIDGTQSVGVMPFDIGTYEPDALVCAAYKWMLGPYGYTLAFFGERFDNGMPIEENWINRLHSEDFRNLVNYQPGYKPKAHRYCAGESSHFIATPMIKASLGLLLDWGAENIQQYARQLSQPYFDQLVEMGCRIESPSWRAGHLTGVRLPEGVDPLCLKAAAEAEKVYLSFRGDAVRISTHVFNNEGDFEKLIKVFAETIRRS